MDMKRLFTDDQAVSPVVGVTMMIAIAVVLAAVVGALVLGLGQGQGAAPSASIEFSFDSSSNNVMAVHDGGDELKLKNVNVVIEDTDGNGSTASIGNSGTWTAGESKQLSSTATSGDIIRVVWSAPNSDKTTVLAEFTVGG